MCVFTSRFFSTHVFGSSKCKCTIACFVPIARSTPRTAPVALYLCEGEEQGEVAVDPVLALQLPSSLYKGWFSTYSSSIDSAVSFIAKCKELKGV